MVPLDDCASDISDTWHLRVYCMPSRYCINKDSLPRQSPLFSISITAPSRYANSR
ncbi:hypothetical protein PAXRUDRAFT_822079 [Paxillus rubicundulus Ve08.2h10]|uniref:Uncharacterized protein n=1 Tax=Paxillus rubicundulus Ve08.2h10 TaxID=930991 RepID=A0A0D0ECW1_9AGAM|nr:hypothetical protein PAXRUDRAFT_822079 [Paxillus rubicundulus Ve08.2h10]